MPRYFLTLSYNGTSFNGWQSQDNTANTVQQVLEEKLSMILQEKIELVGCGRTDAGVNAKDFVAHFDSDCRDLRENKKHWIISLIMFCRPKFQFRISGVFYITHMPGLMPHKGYIITTFTSKKILS